MKKQLLSIILFCLLVLPSFAQILWQNTYGLPNSYEQVNRMIPLSNGGFLLTGYQHINSSLIGKTYTVKTNAVGDTLWIRKILPPGFIYGAYNDLSEDANGNYLLIGSGYSVSQPITDWHGILIKLKPNGDTLWTQRLMTPNADGFTNVVPSNDSGYVITGSNNGQNFIFKYNPDGSLRWKKPHQFSATDTGSFTGLHKMATGYLLFIGGHYTTPFTKVIRVDENGNELYRKSINHVGVARVANEPGGNLLFASGYKFVKLNSQGDTLWSRRYQVHNSYAVGVKAAQQTDDGNYILLIGRSNGMDGDIGLIKVNPNGLVIKDTVLYRFGATEYGTDLWLDAAGNYVIAGHTDNNGLGDPQLFMISLKKWTKTTVGLKEDLPKTAIQIYPNPTTDQLLISGNKPLSGSLTIYNLQGQKLWQQEVDQVSEHHISLQFFAKGIYLLRYQDESGRQISKRINKL